MKKLLLISFFSLIYLSCRENFEPEDDVFGTYGWLKLEPLGKKNVEIGYYEEYFENNESKLKLVKFTNLKIGKTKVDKVTEPWYLANVGLKRTLVMGLFDKNSEKQLGYIFKDRITNVISPDYYFEYYLYIPYLISSTGKDTIRNGYGVKNGKYIKP